MSTHVQYASPHPHYGISIHVQIVGCPISDYSRHLLQEIAGEALLQLVHITSVKRTVQDQARIFYQKHIIEGKLAKYKNPAVGVIIHQARELKKQGRPDGFIKSYLIASIEHVHGDPQSISRHLGLHPFSEVFDVAHYSGSTSGASRHNYMTRPQASAFLDACRKRMPHSITRLGHSAELGFKLSSEFHDEKCFHIEVRQPIFDRLEHPSGTMVA